MPKIVFLTSLIPCFKVKVKGQGQGHGLRSRSTFWCPAVDIRGSALPSAANSYRSHYQSNGNVCLCVCNQWANADNCADAVDQLLISKIHYCPFPPRRKCSMIFNVLHYTFIYFNGCCFRAIFIFHCKYVGCEVNLLYRVYYKF